MLQSTSCTLSRCRKCDPHTHSWPFLALTCIPSQAQLVLMAHSYPASLLASISVCWLYKNMWPNPSLNTFVDVAFAVGSSSDSPYHTDPLGPVKAHLCQDAGWQAVPSGLHWNGLPLPLSVEFMQQWVHAALKYLHTCILEHWQQLLWNCRGLCCFCVFSWQLKQLACIKLPWRHGQINLVCCTGHRHFHYQHFSLCLTSLFSEPASLNWFICWS